MYLIHRSWVALLVGMVLGAALVSTISLLFWSVAPTHETVLVPVARTLGAGQSQAGQLMEAGGRGRRDRGEVGVGETQRQQCTCGQDSSSALKSEPSSVMNGDHTSQDTRSPSLSRPDHSWTPPGTRRPLLQTVVQPLSEQTASRPEEQKQVKQLVNVTRGLIGLGGGGGGRGGGGGGGGLGRGGGGGGGQEGGGSLGSIEEGKKVTDTIVVAVIIDGIHLEWPESVYETWGRDISQVVFYADRHSNISSLQARSLGIHLVKLHTSISLHTRLSVLTHLGEHYVDTHKWFVMMTQDTYMHTDQLGSVLGRLNPDVPLILGSPPDCLVGDGGTVVLSQALMALITPHLHTCLAIAIGMGGSDSTAQLGVCMGEHLKPHCSHFSLMQTYFVGPLVTTKEVYILHHHYKKAQLMAAIHRTNHLQQEVKDVCNLLGPLYLKDCYPSICPCQASHSPQNSSPQCPPSGMVLTVPSHFQPRSIYDYLPWEYFDSKTIYPDQNSHPSYKLKLKRDVKVELQQALTRAVQKISESYGRPLKFKELVNGWVRHNPFVGSEYIFDILLVDGIKKTLSKRVSLVRPLAKNFISVKDRSDKSTVVNIVVPISKVSERFKEFMTMYEMIVLVPRQKASLILSVYGKKDVMEVNNVVAQYRAKYEDVRITVVEGKGVFSRARALQLGLSQLLPHELAFVCDVDMKIADSFLDRCRSNTIQGSRVYYPEFFKLYNMDYVYWNRTHPYHTDKLLREHGHWAYYSFGMLCIFKSDYDSVGGMDINIVGWGGEDVTFFQKIVRKRLKVMRAPDVGLSHRWHPKQCAKTLSTRQYKHCQSSRYENLADRRELARYIHEQGALKTAAGLHRIQSTQVKTETTTTEAAVKQEHQEDEDEQDYNL